MLTIRIEPRFLQPNTGFLLIFVEKLCTKLRRVYASCCILFRLNEIFIEVPSVCISHYAPIAPTSRSNVFYQNPRCFIFYCIYRWLNKIIYGSLSFSIIDVFLYFVSVAHIGSEFTGVLWKCINIPKIYVSVFNCFKLFLCTMVPFLCLATEMYMDRWTK